MTKSLTGTSSTSTHIATAESRAKRRRAKVTVGEVTVMVHRPTAAEVKVNVAKGSSALDRLKKRLMRPGVRVYPKKDVPLYFADVDRPGIYIRKLNGKIERGVVENGTFRVVG